MNSVSIFTILFCLEISKSNTLDYPLIRDYLQWKNLRVILFVTCENTYNGHINESIDYFQSNDIWINHYDISNKKNQIDLSYEHYFVRLSYQYLVVMNLECNYTNTFLNEISKRKMFHFERSWLIFARNTKQINNVLSKENVNVDADIMTAVPIGEKQLEYKIYDIYNPSHERNGKLKMENVGTWSRTWLMKMNETETKFEKRNDFGGLTFLSVITIPSIPKNKTFLEHIDSDEYPHLDSLNKNIYRVFQLLMQMFNFKMAVRRAKIWGYLQGNGSWVGAIGLINRSEIDICLSGLRWEDERYGAFDQTTHAYFAQLSFIFRHPKSSNMTNVFLAPFDIEVWWLILTVGLVFSLTARHIFSVEKEINKIVFNVKNESSFGNSFLMVFGMLFQQGYCGKTLLFSSRILATTTLMLSLCVYQFYGSFIVGSLLTDPPKTIKTIKGLLNSRLEVAIDEVPYILDNFKRVKEASVIQLYNEVMKKPNPFLPVYRGISMVKKGSFAFHTDGSYAYTILKSMLTDKEVCSLQTLKYGPVIPAGPGLPTKSPLREIVKIGIRKIAETGIMGYHWRIWIGHPPKCTNSHIDVMSINISHFSSAIYILVFGIQLSLCILIGEIILRYFIYWKLVNQKKKGTSENRL